jgi:hypothetical protein
MRPTVVVVVAIAFLGRTAVADDDPRPVAEVPASEVPDEPEPYLADFRHPGRLVIGFDFGLGAFDLVCTDCSTKGALHLDVFAGAQITRRVALLAEGWSMMHLLATDEQDHAGFAAHTIATAAARVWLVPRLWLQAGAGAGWLTADRGGDHIRLHGPAAVIAVGGEPGHSWCSGIDLSLRLGGTLVDLGGDVDRTLLYSIGAAVGFHWN